MSQAGPLNGTSGSLPPDVATSYKTDDGTAVPSGNLLQINGGTSIETTASGNQILINFTGSAGGVNSITATAPLTANGVSGSPETGAVTIAISGSTGVSSVTGTANQITSSPTTGAVVLSLPNTLIAPGTITATTSVTSPSFITKGSSSGNVTIESVSGTYNFVLPTTSGTSGYFLTSAAGGTLTWTVPPTGVIATIDGDSGSITGSTVTIWANNAANNSGGTVSFVNSGTTSTLNLSDSKANTFLGNGAGVSGTAGSDSIAVGFGALSSITTGGTYNVCIGINAGSGIQSGAYNIGIGGTALSRCVSGVGNTCIGHDCGDAASGNYNTAIGYLSFDLTNSGSANTIIGYTAGSLYSNSESNNILIGNAGVPTESNVLRIGTQGSGTAQQNVCYIAGIAGVSVSNTNMVTINTSTGQLGSQAVPAGTVTTVSVVSANGFAGTVANATTTPAITLSTTITGVLSGNGTAISGSAVTQYEVLVGGASNAVSSVGPGTAGQVLQSGGNAANPLYSTATYPATAGTSGNVLTSNGTNWVSSPISGGGFTWYDVTGGSATLAAQSGYKADAASLTTFTLPTNNALGDTIVIMGSGSGGWKIVYGASQYIQYGAQATTTTTGNLASSNQYDCCTLVCITASATAPIFQTQSFVGNLLGT